MSQFTGTLLENVHNEILSLVSFGLTFILFHSIRFLRSNYAESERFGAVVVVRSADCRE